MTITATIHQAVLRIPKKAWTPAYDADGTERPGAWVAEITDMPDLTTWPKGHEADRPQRTPAPRRPLALHRPRRAATDLLRDQRPKGGLLADLELRHRRRARCEERIRNARDTGLRNLRLHDTAQNRIWLEIVSLALDLLAWMPMLALAGQTRRWEPKELRRRLLSATAQLVTTGPPRWLRFSTRWPWTSEITRAINQLQALPSPGWPAASTPQRSAPPHRGGGTRRPPDAATGPSTCPSPEKSAPRKHRAQPAHGGLVNDRGEEGRQSRHDSSDDAAGCRTIPVAAWIRLCALRQSRRHAVG
ncbi:transposase [Streptomyces sp. NPDC048419]|uniref:transposase n=1 Tax=Streptomyces sp. NPDC048419 TaxID=3365547 RepID=UPI00372448A1